PVALFASEERENPVVLDRTAPLAVAINAIDGSSNIETNVSMGTIFSVLPVTHPVEGAGLASFMQTGATQLAAGFFVYGPQLALVLTLGAGTPGFGFSAGRRPRVFCLFLAPRHFCRDPRKSADPEEVAGILNQCPELPALGRASQA